LLQNFWNAQQYIENKYCLEDNNAISLHSELLSRLSDAYLGNKGLEMLFYPSLK
jgi:hypothetical protein